MKRFILAFLSALFTITAIAQEQTYINYFTVKDNIAQPVTIYTNLGTYKFSGSYTLYGHISRLSACDANGNKIVNTQPKKRSYSTNKNKPMEFWYVFDMIYSSSGSSYSTGYYSNNYDGGSTDDALAAAGAAAVVAAGALVFVGAANSDWDEYRTRIDIDPIWGQKLGKYGVSVSWRGKSVLGLTAGIGKDTKDHYSYSYNEYGVDTKKTTSMRWMAGLQLWFVNGLNFELGVGSMYHHRLSDVKTSAYVMTNAELHLFNGVGLYTGFGVGKSLSGSAPVKFIWDVGLRLRIFAE